MRIQKKCPVCEKVFIATAPAAIYCSEDCKKKRQDQKVLEEKKRNFPKKKCPICNKIFVATSNRRKYCTDCQEEGNRIKHQQYDQMKKYRVKKKEKYEIEEINRKALAEGLSYGKYVAKYNL